MFHSHKFVFDGKTNEEMGVILVREDNSILMNHGLETETSLFEDSVNGYSEPFYYGHKSTVKPMIFQIVSVDKYENQTPWTLEKRQKVLNWLVQSAFKPFVSEDNSELVYYLKCTGKINKFNSIMEGIIELTMQPSSPYAYTPTVVHNVLCKDNLTHTLEIRNQSNLDNPYYPIIEIRNISNSGDSIEILNITNSSNAFMISGLDEGEMVIVDGLMKTAESSASEHGRITQCNRNWVKLNTGLNILEVRGNCEITVKCQYPLNV